MLSLLVQEPCSAGASGAATAEDAPSSAPVGANPECAAKLNRLFTEQIRELRAFWETHDIDAHMDGSDGPMPKASDAMHQLACRRVSAAGCLA